MCFVCLRANCEILYAEDLVLSEIFDELENYFRKLNVGFGSICLRGNSGKTGRWSAEALQSVCCL